MIVEIDFNLVMLAIIATIANTEVPE